MKIKAIKVHREDFELSRPYTIAFRTVTHVSNMIVQIETDNGFVGWGCGSPEPFVTGETIDKCQNAFAENDLERWNGCDIFEDFQKIQADLKRDWISTPAARAAIDIALYDLKAKSKETPLVKLLGQKHQKLATSITIGIKPLDEILAEADEYLERGFRIIKLKLGKDFESDIEKTLKLRERVKDRMKIRVDLNQGYSPQECIDYFSRTRSAEIEFCEQPISQKAIDEMKALPAEIKKQVAADETLLTPENAKELAADPKACGIFNIKLMKCGGVTPALEIAQTAKESEIDLMWGCMDESRISISAALHTAFASERTRYIDLDGHLDLGRDLVSGGFHLENGVMSLTDQVGLGVLPL